jgi:hypothetical protein
MTTLRDRFQGCLLGCAVVTRWEPGSSSCRWLRSVTGSALPV